MSEKEYIDFKKEFEDFKKELENSKPIFDDDSIEFNDFDNLISDSPSFISDKCSDDNFNIDNKSNTDFPNISLETDNLLLNLIIKKDYSQIEDINIRKKEFFNDLREFLKEFESTDESDQLMEYYEK